MSEQPTAKEIVTGLRQYTYWLAGPHNEDESSLVASAADEIERLERDKNLLRSVLESIKMATETGALYESIAIHNAAEQGLRVLHSGELLSTADEKPPVCPHATLVQVSGGQYQCHECCTLFTIKWPGCRDVRTCLSNLLAQVMRLHSTLSQDNELKFAAIEAARLLGHPFNEPKE